MKAPPRFVIFFSQVDALQDRIADRIMEEMPSQIHYVHDYTEAALGMEAELREKMAALPSAEFEGVLHPAFQEDEIKLILVGAVLGLGVGFFQLYVVFTE